MKPRARALPMLSLLLGLLAPSLACAADAPEHIDVSTLRILSNAGLFVGQIKGYFAQEGVDLSIKWFDAAQETVMATVSGAVDISSGGFTAGFYNIAAKGGLKVIAASSREEPGFPNNGFVVTPAAYAGGLKTVADLPGKRVGINTTGSTQHYAIALVAQKYGYDVSRVTIVPMQNFPNLVAAFKGGQIDVMIAASNIAVQAEHDGYGKLIAWSGDETPWQLGAIYARPDTLAKRRPAIEKFIRAFQRGAADYNHACNQLDAQKNIVIGPECEALIADLSPLIGQTPAQIRGSLSYVDPTLAMNVGDIYNQLAFWKSQNMAPQDADASKMLDLSFVKGNFNIPK